MKHLITVILVLSVVGFGVCAFAQEHPENPGYSEHAEPGMHHVEPGFHRPDPMNLFDPSPPTVREFHEGNPVEKKGPPPFIGPVINFLILVVLGYMAVQRSINPALTARRVEVETQIAEARKLRVEAEKMHREYSERLANMDREIALLKEEFVRTGEAERDRIIAEAKVRAERLRVEGTQAITQELKVLRDDLRREAILAAAAAAEQAVAKNITPSDQQRLADEYLHGMEGARA